MAVLSDATAVRRTVTKVETQFFYFQLILLGVPAEGSSSRFVRVQESEIGW